VDDDDVVLVPTPADVVSLRRTDPGAVATWRREVRSALAGALDAGRPVLGFTEAGEYVIGAAE
jgi:predicted GNAT superfamily acetyltransferase